MTDSTDVLSSPPAPDEGRCDIATRDHLHAADFADGYLPEDALTGVAREQAAEMGLAAVSPATGGALRFLAAAIGARAVVEIGTGTGVSGLWLLRGMRPDGVLTTIDLEAEHQLVARHVFAAAGFVSGRSRIITGRAAHVLPRLADAAYDLVFVHHDVAEYAAAVTAAARLLRSGGIVALGDAFGAGRLGDPTVRDAVTIALREIAKALRDDDGWLPAFLPTTDGLLCAVRR